MATSLIALGKPMLQCCRLAEKNNRHAVIINNDVVMYVQIKQNALVVDRGVAKQRSRGLKDVIMCAIGESQSPETTVQKGSHMSFHRRFRQLNYNDVKRLTANPVNRLQLTDKVRQYCLKWAEGKHSKSARP
uniref:Uncharacterized protein n=2 Tax=Peronospora matthiolae TaxID=2874970 RepID=A0AAV1U4E1_9STRA